MTEHEPGAGGAIAVALAFAGGMIAQSLARNLQLPGIVLLLGAGVLLGPDVLDIVRPDDLGPALQILVGFAVSVILFEGGLNLSWRRVRSQARVIQLLITVGAAVTAIGGALAARFILGWEWRLAIAFGSLVVVTGPTVVTPLLRRIRVRFKVETVLEAEGVLIDAVGAVLAVVVLQVLLSPTSSTIAGGPLGVLSRLGLGIAIGVAGGILIVLALRFRAIVPEGLENVFTLSFVLALFQLSNVLLAESGIMAVTAAGMVVGNAQTRVRRELMEFKEQLTIMLIGMLFILLAAGVRLDDMRELGVPGLLTVACLMFVVRPICVAICTHGSDLDIKERAFLAWLAPRGVVAAAVASLFSRTLSTSHANGFEPIPGAERLSAMVFLVIAGTVLVQGLSGGIVAQLLGLRRATSRGVAIFGANPLGLAIGNALREAGHHAIFVERDPVRSQGAEQEGFKVVFGNILEERTMLRAQLDERAAIVAATLNQEVNLLLARTVAEEFKAPHFYIACRSDRSDVSERMVKHAEAEILFGRPRDLELWDLRIRRKLVKFEEWEFTGAPAATDNETEPVDPFNVPENLLLPLITRRGSKTFPVNSRSGLSKGDGVRFVVFEEQHDEAIEWLERHGWKKSPEPEPEPEQNDAG